MKKKNFKIQVFHLQYQLIIDRDYFLVCVEEVEDMSAFVSVRVREREGGREKRELHYITCNLFCYCRRPFKSYLYNTPAGSHVYFHSPHFV